MPDPGQILRGYRTIQRVLRTVVAAFFRRVEVTGKDAIPKGRGGLLVSWHPNGLVDPALILTAFPRRVVFGARHGLFAFPILGTVLRRVGTVPIYRAIDRSRGSDADRKTRNRQSLDALATEVARGSFSALFPEGVSHDAPHLMELKTGAARLYYRARQLCDEGEPPPVIVPVGLHYDDKQMFRSNALVGFHPPLRLPAHLDVAPAEDEDEAVTKQRARELTDLVEQTLREVVHATDDWALHALMHRARKLVRAERAHRAGRDPGPVAIGERVAGFARVRAGYYARRQTHPDEVAALQARVAEYDADLRTLHIEDHELDRDPRLASPWLFGIVMLQAVAVFGLLPPLVLWGYVANLPTAAAIVGIAKASARKDKDEATVKLLLGALAFPLTWIAVGVLAGWGHTQLHAAYPQIPDAPILAGLTTAILAALGGAIGVRYLRVAKETARAIRVRLTRRRRWYTVDRLASERAALHDAMLALVEGVALPGAVAADGSVAAEDTGSAEQGPPSPAASSDAR